MATQTDIQIGTIYKNDGLLTTLSDGSYLLSGMTYLGYGADDSRYDAISIVNCIWDVVEAYLF